MYVIKGCVNGSEICKRNVQSKLIGRLLCTDKFNNITKGEVSLNLLIQLEHRVFQTFKTFQWILPPSSDG